MKHSIRRILSAAALILIVCLAFSACSFGRDKGCKHEETQLVGEIAASCTQAGYTGDTVCTKCEKVVKQGTEIAMLAHTYDDGRVTKNPTCIEQGTTTYTCTSCGAVKTSAIETVEHQDVFHDAQDGSHNHTCTRCTLLKNETHIPTDEGVKYPATCDEAAYTEHTCSACGGVYKLYDEGSEPLGHALGAWETVLESTCCTSGLKAQACANEGCTYRNTIEIPMTGRHYYEYEEYVTAPSCVEDGVALYVCHGCGASEERTVAATGIHDYIALEESDGFILKECADCDASILSVEQNGQTTTVLSGETLGDLGSALEMALQGASMQFPQSIVEMLAQGGNTTFGAGELNDAEQSAAVNGVDDEAIKETLTGAPVFDLSLSVDGQSVSSEFPEKVLVTVPYDNGDQDAEGIVIYYLAADGSTEEITDARYNADRKEVSFFVDHFSFYAVAYRETQEMRCRRGNHVYEAAGTVEAKCYTFGYTLYECSCCHRNTVDDIVDRLPHSYGEIIAAAPSCEHGDYSTRVCQNDGCGYTLNVQFFGATGHKIAAAPTCTDAAKCTKCNQVIVPALGHDYTAWETVVEATEEKTGLRRRYCLTCGKMEEGKIAMVGAVKPIEFDSYAELVDLIFADLLKMEGGKIVYNTVTQEGMITENTIEVMKKDGAYVLLLTTEIERYGESATTKIYYEDGKFIFTNGEDDYMVSDVDAIEEIPFIAFEGLLKSFHAELDEYVKQVIETAHTFIDAEENATMFGKINELLSESDAPHTVEELHALIDSIENLYAYLSLRLGYDTMANFTEAVVLPGKDEIHTILTAFMTAEEKNGVTTYTLTADPLVESLNAIIKWLEEHQTKKLGEVLYDLFGEDLKAYDASLTDFGKAIDMLAKEFPGTMKVSDAINKFITVFDGVLTLDDLYAIADRLLAYYAYGTPMGDVPSEFSIEAIIEEHGDMTLDQLCALALESEEVSLTVLYAMLKDTCANTVFGNMVLPIGGGQNVAAMIAMGKQALEAVNIKDDISFSLDANGRLVGFICEQEISVEMQEGAEPMILQSVTASFENKADYKVTLPEEFKDVSYNVNASYDKDGNLVIEGLDGDVDFKFEIEGSKDVAISDYLKLDEELSETLGIKIYKTDKKYWTETNETTIYYYDGKYYASRDYDGWDSNYKKPTASVEQAWDLGALIDDPAAALPTDLTSFDGYAGYSSYNGEMPAWKIPFGLLFMNENGQWMMAGDYGTSVSGEGEYSFSIWGEATPYEIFFDGMYLSSVSENSQNVLYEGKEYQLYTAYYANAFEDKTRSVSSIFVNDTFHAVEVEERNSHNIVSFRGEIEFPAEEDYDKCDRYERAAYIVDQDGNLKEITYEVCEIYVYLPTYYVKVTDTVYAKFSSYGLTFYDKDRNAIRRDFYTAGFESMTLPDGNVLSIVGRDDESKYCIANGYEAVYGYAKTVDGHFIQTIAYLKDGKIAEVRYWNRVDTISVPFDQLFDLDASLTEQDGKYTIAASLIAELKKACTEENDAFSFRVYGTKELENVGVDYRYNFGLYVNEMNVNLGIFGGVHDEAYEDSFYDYFNSSDPEEFSLALDENGNLVVYYEDGTVISGVDFNFNNAFPADSILKYNADLSRKTGLNIYSYGTEQEITHHIGSFVYQNGKYYEYDTEWTYELGFVDPVNFAKNAKIEDMYYRFDLMGIGGELEGAPVYMTDIVFGEDIDQNEYKISVYTFFVDGVLYVAQQGRVTGNSLLTFESYVPYSEYINSLKVEFDADTTNGRQYYQGNQKVTVYSASLYLYETDGQGNPLSYDGSSSVYHHLNVDFVIKSGKFSVICDSLRLGLVVLIGDQADLSECTGDGIEMSTQTVDYYNKTVDIVEFTKTTIESITYDFVKLAGKYYDYDDVWPRCYRAVAITEEAFTQTSRDLVWYYEVYNPDTFERSYYTEFIPSDYGFTPAGKQLSESELGSGSYTTRTLLGHTPDGDELYEVAFYTETSANKPWTTVTQDDGTVFYHVDGKGYLRTQTNMYVPARQIKNQDGSTEIVCMIRGAFVHDDYLKENVNLLSDFYRLENGDMTLVLTPELLEFAKHNRSSFYVSFRVNGNSEDFDCDRLEALFKAAEEQ